MAWPRPTVVLACFGAAPLGNLIAVMCRDLAAVVRVDDRTLLVSRALRAGAALVVLPVVDGDGTPTAPLIARLSEEQLMVGVCVIANAISPGIAGAIQAGAHVLSWTTPPELREQLDLLVHRSAMSDHELRGLENTLEGVTPPPLHALLVQCTMLAHRRLTVQELAMVLGVAPRTLHRVTQRAGWPSPAEVIAWGRALRAALSRWHGVDTAHVIARLAGFGTVGVMRHSVGQRLRISDQVSDVTPLRVRQALQRRLRETSGPAAHRASRSSRGALD